MIRNEELEKELEIKLIELMRRYQAPDCQWERMGLKKP
jgi:hypothetical protein